MSWKREQLGWLPSTDTLYANWASLGGEYKNKGTDQEPKRGILGMTPCFSMTQAIVFLTADRNPKRSWWQR